MATLDPSLQELLDRQAVAEVLSAYCRGVDRLDIELFRTVFWPDGGYETGSGGFLSAGAADFAEQILHRTMRAQYAATQHILGNHRCRFPAPGIAESEVYFHAFHRPHPTAEGLALALGASRAREMLARFGGTAFDLLAGGRYVDRLEKREAAWRIRSRRLIVDWTRIAPATEWGPDNTLGQFQFTGARAPEDASYLPFTP